MFVAKWQPTALSIYLFFSRSQNTWEPEVNIYAKDKIAEFEKKFKGGAKRGRGRKAKIVTEDPDYENISDLYRKFYI